MNLLDQVYHYRSAELPKSDRNELTGWKQFLLASKQICDMLKAVPLSFVASGLKGILEHLTA